MLWYQNKQSIVSTNQSVVLVLTAQPFEKEISTFSKKPKYKTIGSFSLSLKNTFLLKD